MHSSERRLTTHVLDIRLGRPAAGLWIELWRWTPPIWERVASECTNEDGRTGKPLLNLETSRRGVYELRFQVGAYFNQQGVSSDPIPFLDEIPVRFGIYDLDRSYHVPLLVTPWSYSTYRGS